MPEKILKTGTEFVARNKLGAAHRYRFVGLDLHDLSTVGTGCCYIVLENLDIGTSTCVEAAWFSERKIVIINKEKSITEESDMSKYEIIPARPEQYKLFFAMSPEQDAANGCIGHVRMDFGTKGTEFWTTWHKRGPEEWNNATFKADLSKVADELRKSVLKDFASMKRFCAEHGGQIDGGIVQNYGYIVETKGYRYYLRCNPVMGDYHAYLTCCKK